MINVLMFGLDIKMFLFIPEEFPWPGLVEFELIKQKDHE